MTSQSLDPIHDLARHPAVLAWRAAGGRDRTPIAVHSLKNKRPKKSHKSRIYRLVGGGDAERTIVAKECRKETGAVEHFVYERVLPRLPLPGLRLLASTPSEDPDKVWLFLEDAGETAFDEGDPRHRRIAARWTAAMHARAAALPEIGSLPDRGPDHYRSHLRSARIHLARARRSGRLRPREHHVLDRIDTQLDRLENAWHEVEALCGGLPRTLVHGDLVAKNVRLTARAESPTADLVVFDWETCGVGIPGPDLDSIGIAKFGSDIDEYLRGVATSWPGFDIAPFLRMARLGRLFRLLAAIDWIGPSLPHGSGARPMATADKYARRLGDAMKFVWER